MKKLTIPRLELYGALLLAKLVNVTIKALQINFDKVFLWCDSKIVLSWIAGNPQPWKTFVANKVVKINKNVKNVQWSYVSTRENPADHASRGKNANVNNQRVRFIIQTL